MFTKEDGDAYHPEVASRFLRQAVKRAVLPEVRLHDLRHTHATLALRAGIPPRSSVSASGTRPSRSRSIAYSHAIPARQEEAAAKIVGLVFES